MLILYPASLFFTFQAVKQFIDLCNNLRAKYSAAATTAASPAASVSVSTSAVGAASSTSSSTSFSATASSLTTATGAGAAAQPQQKQHQQILVQFPTEGTEGGAGAGAGASPAIRQISPTTAVKFLHARKFDVLRAVSLYEQHEQIRQKEHLYNIDPDVETLRSELQTGKFTILVSITPQILFNIFY